MVEKYRGFIPANSIWYKLDKQETITLLKHQGEFENLTLEEQKGVDSAEIQGIPGKIEEVEQTLINAGLNIVTLYD